MGRRGPKSFAELSVIRPHPRATVLNATITAPVHLKPETQAWWVAVIGQHDLEPHQLRLLTAGCEAWDRKEQARQAIAASGLVFEDDRGAIKARPEISIERDSRIAFVRCMRELNLKVAPPAAGGVQPSELFR